VITAPQPIRDLAEKANLPTTMTLMALGMLPKAHPLSLGMLGMHGARSTNFILQEADLLIVLGARFDDRAIGKTEQFCPNAKIIHVDIDRSELGKIKQPHVAIQGDVAEVLAQLIPQIEAQPRDEWRQLVADLQREFPCAIPQESDPLSHYGLINAVAACVDDEAIITTDVGQHQMWTAQAYPLNRPRQWLTSGGLGTMGFGLPAAIGAALANPQRKVICFSGDGSLMMNIQEMATAVTQGTGITICLLNNNYLGMVRQMQELFYGKRYSATCLRRRPSCPGGCKGPNDQCPEYVPDFVKLAESYGAYGIRVEKEEDIDAAFAEAKKHTDAPTIIEFMIATDELVLPMVKSGNPMSEMILK